MKLYCLYLDYHQAYNSVYLDFLYILLVFKYKNMQVKKWSFFWSLHYLSFHKSLAIIYVAIAILSHEITHTECTI